MFCALCGAPLRPGVQFCESCGAVVDASATGIGLDTEPRVAYAGFWIRFVAALIDGIILGIVGGVLGLLLPSAVGALFTVVVSAGYFIYSFSQWNGQPIGARAVGVKVVDVNGGLLTPSAATIRWGAANISSIAIALAQLSGNSAAFALAALLGLLQLIGYLMMLGSPMKQTFHDRVAGSIVVKVNP